MVWYSHLLKSLPVCCDSHNQGFGIVNKAEVDVFLELSCFFDDPVDVGNLISGSCAVSRPSLNIWVCGHCSRFTVTGHQAISSSTAILLPPSIFSKIMVFSKELALHIRWAKYWSFSFSISPSSEYSGMISFRTD